MKKPRIELENLITDECYSISIDPKRRDKVYQFLSDQYNIPASISFDIITLRKSLLEFSDFILFCVLAAIRPGSIEAYFTDDEINYYKNSKYEVETIKFPLIIDDMVQITDDQWIGRTSAKQLMQLCGARLLNYNENTQRTLRRIVKGGNEYFQIFTNKESVRQIRESMENGTYIPTPITLNVPEDSVFSYSHDNHQLIFEELKHFDISDGYHRYLALSQAANSNIDFDYNMELRIVCFTESKAQHFVFQEDQKTKMRKIDSDALNQNRISNIIAKRLNEDPLCDVKGMINRNDSIIPLGEFTRLLEYFFLRDISKKDERSKIIQISKDLRDKFNALYELMPELFKSKWSNKTLIIIVFLFSKDDIKLRDIPKLYNQINEKLGDKNKLFTILGSKGFSFRRVTSEMNNVLMESEGDK